MSDEITRKGQVVGEFKAENASDAEYHEFVKKSVENGDYFEDALDWYMLRYVNPVVDRTIMAFVSIIACVALYFLVQIISNAFPLVQEIPIVIRDHDASIYRPMISEIYDKNDVEVRNVDEATAKYLLKNYVNDRQSYDFRNSDLAAMRQKFNRVKNNSSFVEYENFQRFMSRDNEKSPINNFGLNIYASTEIESVTFSRQKPKNQYEKIKWLFSNRIPNKADVVFTVLTHNFDEKGQEKISRQKYLAKIKFNFGGLDRNAKIGVLNFVVNEYKLYKIK